jgi:hypothetical protein
VSRIQVAIIVSVWTIALIPLTVTLAVFVLTKMGVLRTPIADYYSGPIAKIVTLLTVGGFAGVMFMVAGLVVGLGVAGIWLGVLNMQGNAGLWGSAVMHWDHLAFILLIAPAVTVIFVTGLLFYADLNINDESTRNKPPFLRRPAKP